MADDFRMTEEGGSKVYSKQGEQWCACIHYSAYLYTCSCSMLARL